MSSRNKAQFGEDWRFAAAGRPFRTAMQSLPAVFKALLETKEPFFFFFVQGYFPGHGDRPMGRRKPRRATLLPSSLSERTEPSAHFRHPWSEPPLGGGSKMKRAPPPAIEFMDYVGNGQ